MRRWLVLTGFLTVFWIFIRGAAADKLVGELLIGLALSSVISYSLRDMYSGDLDISHYLRVSPVIIHYFGDFIGELFRANLDVAKRVVHPGTPISPEVLEIPLRVESGPAVTTLANSITLTPGTLTMDYSSDRNCLYVHAINGGSEEEEIRETIQNWEDMLVKIFDNNSSIDAAKGSVKK